MNTATPADDLDALRLVIGAVKDFKPDEQQRIFRWAAEKLGLPAPFGSLTAPLAQPHVTPLSISTPGHGPSVVPSGQDIKSFVAAKNPRSDVQFAATVAYYFRFEAPQSGRKDSINGENLQDACRTAGRDRLKNPGQTLRNAHQLGLLDKTDEADHFSINTVGENLVAMTLPGNQNLNGKHVKRPKRTGSKPSVNRKAIKKTPAKKA